MHDILCLNVFLISTIFTIYYDLHGIMVRTDLKSVVAEFSCFNFNISILCKIGKYNNMQDFLLFIYDYYNL